MRQTLVKAEGGNADRNFDYLLQRRGMFSYTGLSEEQVDRLRDEFGVYLIAGEAHVSPGLMLQMCTHRVAKFAAVM